MQHPQHHTSDDLEAAFALLDLSSRSRAPHTKSSGQPLQPRRNATDDADEAASIALAASGLCALSLHDRAAVRTDALQQIVSRLETPRERRLSNGGGFSAHFGTNEHIGIGKRRRIVVVVGGGEDTNSSNCNSLNHDGLNATGRVDEVTGKTRLRLRRHTQHSDVDFLMGRSTRKERVQPRAAERREHSRQ